MSGKYLFRGIKSTPLTSLSTGQFNPPHAGVTSVLIVPDTDTDVDKSQPRHPTSTAVNTDSTQADKTGLGDLMELLNTLPTHVLDSARRRNRPAASPVPSSAITLSAQQPQSAKPCVKSSASTTAAGGSVTTKAPNVAFAHGEASDNHTSASPHTTITHMASTTAAAVSPLPSTLFKRKASIGGSNANMPDTSRPSAPHTPSTVRAPTSGSRALIDSPLRGIGFAAFAAPKECYVLGYWTRAVLEFVHCDQEVIPIIESRLVHLSYDEDDVELQASLAEELTGELSHFVVNLLKLDAFLKSVGRYA